MKKVFKYSVSIAALFLALFFITVTDSNASEKTLSTGENDITMNMTIGEIELRLLDYLHSTGRDYSVGSEELSSYLLNQLLSEDDEKLKAVDQYDNILAYAAEYIYRESLPSVNGKEQDITTVSSWTLNDIRDEVTTMDEEATNQPMTRAASKSFTYDRVKAVNYALKYAKNYNKSYASFSGSGGDCTNFASQVLRAGGAKDGKTGYPTNYDWSYSQTNTGPKASVAWINANTFRLYWQMNAKSVTKHTTNGGVSKKAVKGDILSYVTKKTGRSWHSAIVTGKSGNVLYVSQHSSDRKNDNWDKIGISFKENDVYVIKPG